MVVVTSGGVVSLWWMGNVVAVVVVVVGIWWWWRLGKDVVMSCRCGGWARSLPLPSLWDGGGWLVVSLPLPSSIGTCSWRCCRRHRRVVRGHLQLQVLLLLLSPLSVWAPAAAGVVVTAIAVVRGLQLEVLLLLSRCMWEPAAAGVVAAAAVVAIVVGHGGDMVVARHGGRAGGDVVVMLVVTWW